MQDDDPSGCVLKVLAFFIAIIPALIFSIMQLFALVSFWFGGDFASTHLIVSLFIQPGLTVGHIIGGFLLLFNLIEKPLFGISQKVNTYLLAYVTLSYLLALFMDGSWFGNVLATIFVFPATLAAITYLFKNIYISRREAARKKIMESSL
jgi:hypothetical protein